jgi:hypothetical protein
MRVVYPEAVKARQFFPLSHEYRSGPVRAAVILSHQVGPRFVLTEIERMLKEDPYARDLAAFGVIHAGLAGDMVARNRMLWFADAGWRK